MEEGQEKEAKGGMVWEGRERGKRARKGIG